MQKSERCGGFFSLGDFAEHRSRWEEPLCATYRGYEVCVPPANSYGLLLLLQLKILAENDLAKYGHNSPEYVALQVKAKEEAWRTGQSWIADPDQYRREDIVDFLESFPGHGRETSLADSASNRGKDTTYIATANKILPRTNLASPGLNWACHAVDFQRR